MKPPKPITATSAVAKTARKQAEIVEPVKAHRTRVDMRIDDFLRLLVQKGYYLSWRKSVLCTCVNPQTMSAKADCEICDQSGMFFVEPIEVQGLMTGLESKKNVYRNLGEWLEGSSTVTVVPECRLSYQDSLEMLHSVSVFNEYVIKGNRRGPRVRLPVGTDSARYKVVRMLHIFYHKAGVPTKLEEGIDFTITKEGWIRWTERGNTVPKDTILSVNYEFHPVWVVTTHPHFVRDTLVKFKSESNTARSMPIQAAVKLDYLVSNITIPNSGVIP